jgi:hypothetical protein
MVDFGSECVKTAWNDSSPESTVKGFKKRCVSKNTNGKDNVQWKEDQAENSSCNNERFPYMFTNALHSITHKYIETH